MKTLDRDLLLRLTVVVLVPPLLWLVFHPRPEGFVLLVHLASALAQGELYWIVLRDDPPWLRLVGVALGLWVGATLVWLPGPALLALSLMAVSMIVAALHLFQ